mmetsp:Transcript_64569/g.156036  ORF Transcript_64569/g.156036 Transcript_64569/m.156036 type:complete len:334 (+) Transcript_64569:84-1085(+)
MPASRWGADREYMIQKFGAHGIEVEHTVDEGELSKMQNTTSTQQLGWFLARYQTTPMYTTSSLPRSMAQHVFLLPFLNCGGFTRRNARARLWWSAWPTRSTIHSDAHDNINCFFAGTKRIALWADTDFDRIYMDSRDVNASSVDLEKYPQWDQLEWYDSRAKAGDCIYIPVGWHHYFEGSEQIDINVNMFWTSPRQFDAQSCYRLRERGFDPSQFLSTLRDCAWGHGEYSEDAEEDLEQKLRSMLPTRCSPRVRLPSGMEEEPEFFDLTGYCNGEGYDNFASGEDMPALYHYQPEDDDPEELWPRGVGEDLQQQEVEEGEEEEMEEEAAYAEL